MFTVSAHLFLSWMRVKRSRCQAFKMLSCLKIEQANRKTGFYLIEIPNILSLTAALSLSLISLSFFFFLTPQWKRQHLLPPHRWGWRGGGHRFPSAGLQRAHTQVWLQHAGSGREVLISWTGAQTVTLCSNVRIPLNSDFITTNYYNCLTVKNEYI